MVQAAGRSLLGIVRLSDGGESTAFRIFRQERIIPPRIATPSACIRLVVLPAQLRGESFATLSARFFEWPERKLQTACPPPLTIRRAFCPVHAALLFASHAFHFHPRVHPLFTARADSVPKPARKATGAERRILHPAQTAPGIDPHTHF